ncbi:NAD(P)-dependent oxidoreductase [Actinocorallia longicatena]|uniref:NAD(P)-dependent oxidoreductase n=1 Tax=Actinocorallia longicatena TaxID=111803 RepID=A0ABP6Q5U2_9ACTN
MTRVGFIGLGSQGAPMARRIIEEGHPTTLWARRPSSVEPFAGTSAKIAASPAELAAASDLVCVCVVADDDVEQVLTGDDGVLSGLREGAVIAVHSTIAPATCERLAERAAASGIRLVDAPVSGGGPAAAERRLLVMAGGDDDAVEFCRPVFAAFADPVVHLGPLGSGLLAKLLNNVLFTANLGVAAETLALGRSLDLDPRRLAEVLGHGSAASFALGRIAGSGGDLEGFGSRAGALLRKDVAIMDGLLPGAGSAAPVMAAADAALELMLHPR